MFQSFFNGLSGMFNFSQSLDNVSNNIANMNTPGFRGTDNFFRSVNGSGNQGLGTSLDGTSQRLTMGEIRQTGNETDLALTGKGFFVLRNDSGEIFYTRAGQFGFNEDNILVDSSTQMAVMGITSADNLESIDISDFRILPPLATTDVSFSGNLSSTDSDHQISNVLVFDALGETHALTIDFTNVPTSTNAWAVAILDEDDNSLGGDEISFDLTGAPAAGGNSFSIDVTFGGETQTIEFNFGEPGSFNGTTQFSSSDSSLGVSDISGNGILGLTGVEFSREGVIQFTYSNGETREGGQVAIAAFNNEALLEVDTGSLYRANSNILPDYSRAGDEGLGNIQGGSIELSNIDLTQEFADILIIQRGYQASSRVMSVSNELIEELYNSTRG